MSGDPFGIFHGTPGKHNTLRMLWPELYDCLVGVEPEPVPEPIVACVLGDCPQTIPRSRAVARTRHDGPPACAMHVRLHADRPGGWPLSRERS